MGATKRSTGAGSALFGKARLGVLAAFFTRPGEELYLRQVARLAGAGMGAAQRELKRLTDAGILERRVHGRQVYYRASETCPFYAELKGLVIKSAGLRDVLASALAGLSERISAAFIFGSFARGQEDSGSDVDLMVVGELSLKELISALSGVEEKLGREVNPVIYPRQEFRQRVSRDDHFISRVMGEEKIFVIGDADELK